jgi:hypothetical protein
VTSHVATFNTGLCITHALIVLATSLDELEADQLSRLAFFDAEDSSVPWGFSDQWNMHICSASMWKGGLRAYLSQEGAVRISGPGGRPECFLQLPDAGVFRPGAAGYGYVNRIRTVGQSLYVCGAHRQVYRYIPGERNPLSGRFVDVAGPMRQPPLPKAPEQEGAAFEAWADLDIVQFNDIAGTAENDVYATGDETWHFDGDQWRRLELKAERETMHVIKVLDEQRILIGGSNGYLFMGNARDGFVNIGHTEEHATITGLEQVAGQLFVATDKGLFTLSAQGQPLTPCATGLEPELQDAHLLEAKEGVLWSFGYKDLAYIDTKQDAPQWVRVHHPDNPRIGATHVQSAASSGSAAVATPPSSDMPTWLAAGTADGHALDVAGLIARVGHSGVGGFVAEQLGRQGMALEQVLQVQRSQRYAVAVPGQGVILTLQYQGPKRSSKDAAPPPPKHWALAEVRLQTRHADPKAHWQGAWPGGLDPDAPDLRERARGIWGEPDVDRPLAMSFFVPGSQGAAWTVALEWTADGQRFHHLSVLHLGGYLPWRGGGT